MDAGLIDAAAGERILVFEENQRPKAALRWPVYLALGFGGLLVAAGVSLFVAAHWDELSPAARFSLVVAMVAVLHVGGAWTAGRFAALAATFHAVGTAVLGAAIFLAAQIFNLQENWPAGVLLWAVGAAFGFLLLRDWVQAGWAAVLIPAWLVSQWSVTMESRAGGTRPLAMGLLLLTLCYLSVRMEEQSDSLRRVLAWIGGLGLFPCAFAAILMVREGVFGGRTPWNAWSLLLAWVVALAVPLGVAWALRGKNILANVLSAIWAFAVIEVSASIGYGSAKHLRSILLLYLLCALGAVGMVAWGLREKRRERVNLGVAAFALTVLFFYFDGFMDKMDRSASLLMLGILCIAGGWLLERTRRRLVAQLELST